MATIMAKQWDTIIVDAGQKGTFKVQFSFTEGAPDAPVEILPVGKRI